MQKAIAGSRDVLQNAYGFSAVDFTPPYGDYNPEVKSYVEKCYESMRSTETGYNAGDYDRYDLKVINIGNTTTAGDIANAVNFAKVHKVWVIFVYHEVDSETANQYAASLGELKNHLQIIKDSGVPVVTIAQGLAATTH